MSVPRGAARNARTQARQHPVHRLYDGDHRHAIGHRLLDGENHAGSESDAPLPASDVTRTDTECGRQWSTDRNHADAARIGNL